MICHDLMLHYIQVRDFSQYKFLYNCVGHYMGTLNDDDYDYIYDLDEETRELVNESEATGNRTSRGDARNQSASEGVYVNNEVEGAERPFSIESEYVYNMAEGE